MIPLNLSRSPEGVLEVLCLGAHADDIEIGCGGTLLTLLSRQRARVSWVVFSARGQRAREAAQSAEAFLQEAESKKVALHEFPDGRFPSHRAEIKGVFEDLKASSKPDLILTHDEADLHQDHRVLGELSRETFRDHLILGYEIPKYDGGLRSPSVFVPVDTAVRTRKIELIMESFPSQREKGWFDPPVFQGLMRLRGVECACESGYAEGFLCRTAVVEL